MPHCTNCHEPVEHRGQWVHAHSGDVECWTGDGSAASPLTVERQRTVDAAWLRSAAWDAPFHTKLDAIMVGSFFNDDDYNAVRAYLIAVYQPRNTEVPQ
jgi:hypothetical protein